MCSRNLGVPSENQTHSKHRRQSQETWETICINVGKWARLLFKAKLTSFKKLIFDTHSGSLLLIIRTLDGPNSTYHFSLQEDRTGFMNNVLHMHILIARYQ